MGKYQSKPKVVEAHQFLPPLQIPNGVMNVYEGSPGVYSGQVRTIQGTLVDVYPGEWIVTEVDGIHHYPIDKKEFERLYQPV